MTQFEFCASVRPVGSVAPKQAVEAAYGLLSDSDRDMISTMVADVVIMLAEKNDIVRSLTDSLNQSNTQLAGIEAAGIGAAKE